MAASQGGRAVFGWFTAKRSGLESSRIDLTDNPGMNRRRRPHVVLATSQLLIVLLVVFLPTSASASLINSGSAEIRGTWRFDFETGGLGGPAPPADIWWEQLTSSTRQLTPVGGSALAALGMVDFASVSEADLLELVYTADSIPGPGEGAPDTLLDVGSVFAVRTGDGNYAKALVTSYDNGVPNIPFYDMHIQFEVFDGVVPPSTPMSSPWSLALLGAGLLAVLLVFVVLKLRRGTLA